LDTQSNRQNQQVKSTEKVEQHQAETNTPEKNIGINVDPSTNPGTKNVHLAIVPIVPAVDTIPITSILGKIVPMSLDVGSLQPIRDIVMSLDNYIFDDKTKPIVKRINKRRNTTHHEEVT